MTSFVEFIEAGDMDEAAQEKFNRRVNDHFEGTRDYIVTHYKTNTRSDTDYWRANARNNLSDSLRQLLGTWLASRPLVRGLAEGRFRIGLLDDVLVRAAGRGRPVSRTKTCGPRPRPRPCTTRPPSTTWSNAARSIFRITASG